MGLDTTLADMPPAYEYEYTQRRPLRNVVYYTDTMGTLRAKCTKRSISWSGVEKRPIPPSARSVDLTTNRRKEKKRKEVVVWRTCRTSSAQTLHCALSNVSHGDVNGTEGGGLRVRLHRKKKPQISTNLTHQHLL